jgi:hypothetical protein
VIRGEIEWHSAHRGVLSPVIDSVVRKAIESRIASAGLHWLKLQHFELRASEKKVSATLLLEGEPTPVTVRLSYRLEATDVVVESIDAGRPWMTEALALVLLKHGGRWPLPSGLPGTVIRMLL